MDLHYGIGNSPAHETGVQIKTSLSSQNFIPYIFIQPYMALFLNNGKNVITLS